MIVLVAITVFLVLAFIGSLYLLEVEPPKEILKYNHNLTWFGNLCKWIICTPSIIFYYLSVVLIKVWVFIIFRKKDNNV